VLAGLGMPIGPPDFGYALAKLTLAQVTPVLPFLLLVLVLIFRPKGLLGTRED
jgi:branched-chain amino acid transport system permease protein